MIFSHSETAPELYIEHNLSMLDRRTKENPEVRAILFQNMTCVINGNPKMATTVALVGFFVLVLKCCECELLFGSHIFTLAIFS